MSRTLRRLRNLLFRRSWRDKVLVFQAYLLLGFAWAVIRLLTLRRMAGYLGEHQLETSEQLPEEYEKEARRVAWAIDKASPYTLWTSNCYPQAITAKILLRRRRIPSTLYLGAAFKSDSSDLEAHAWLRCGLLYVTGGPGHQNYGVLAAFGDPEPDANTGEQSHDK